MLKLGRLAVDEGPDRVKRFLLLVVLVLDRLTREITGSNGLKILKIFFFL